MNFTSDISLQIKEIIVFYYKISLLKNRFFLNKTKQKTRKCFSKKLNIIDLG
jgi:hypothetical protein